MSLSYFVSGTFKEKDIRKTISLETTLLDFRQFDVYDAVWWKYVYVFVYVYVCVCDMRVTSHKVMRVATDSACNLACCA